MQNGYTRNDALQDLALVNTGNVDAHQAASNAPIIADAYRRLAQLLEALAPTVGGGVYFPLLTPLGGAPGPLDAAGALPRAPLDPLEWEQTREFTSLVYGVMNYVARANGKEPLPPFNTLDHATQTMLALMVVQLAPHMAYAASKVAEGVEGAQ
jgi:hypothetical protein